MDPMEQRYHAPGTAPGTLTAPAVRRMEKVTIQVMEYGPDSLEERWVETAEATYPLRDNSTLTWITVTGLHDIELLERLGSHFGLHPLALEDVLNTGQRPKIEDYDQHQFVVLRLLDLEPRGDDGGEELRSEQISLFVGGDYVIAFLEAPCKVFEPVRERLRKGKGRLRKAGSDYLAYALIDAMVDHFFPLLERYGERVEDLEDELLAKPTQATLQKIHDVKRDLLMLRRTAWPQREVILSLEREDSGLVKKETKVYLRDCYDHTIQIMDMIETYRDLATGMLDVYLSSISNRMNEVMKVLTIIATIFIPLTFIAGIYGMNFNHQTSPLNMPELDWYWGYPGALLLMGAVAVVMIMFFRRKGWL